MASPATAGLGLNPRGLDARALVARYGFRRIESLRIRAADGGASSAVLTGVAHRYPRSIAVPLRVASRLVAAGVPFSVERATPPGEPTGA